MTVDGSGGRCRLADVLAHHICERLRQARHELDLAGIERRHARRAQQRDRRPEASVRADHRAQFVLETIRPQDLAIPSAPSRTFRRRESQPGGWYLRRNEVAVRVDVRAQELELPHARMVISADVL